MASLTPGTVLADTYRVVRLIGTGGMGEVYEATHDRLAGRYAIKVLSAEITSRVDIFQRFRREAEVTSRLRHPNIVQVLDFNVTPDGHPYLVLEYLDGVELAAEIARVGPMPGGRVLDIVGQSASALTAAQEHKIVHRDLKPQNLFLVRLPAEEREVVKVVDFGISKVREATTRLTQEAAIMGTPQYMAPEQAQGRLGEIDERTDEFALAAITYELFTGRPAFRGDSVQSVLYQVVHEHPEPMPLVVPTVGPEVDAVVRKALSKSPDDRYPSALVFHRQLARAVGAEHDVRTVRLPETPPPLAATALDKPTTTLGLAAAPVQNRAVRPGMGPRRWLLLGLGATVVVAGAALALSERRGSRGWQTPPPGVRPPAEVAEGSSTPGRSAAPSLPQHAAKPAGGTSIQVVYSTEKRDWIEAVTADFMRSHPGVRVGLAGTGSFESAREILDGRLQPTVWSPSDSVLLKMLHSDWRTRHRSDLFAAGDEATQPLLLSPLVFIVWEDRARVLKKSAGGTIDWRTVRRGVTSAKGWKAIGGEARWGTVKLGHTDPTQSNSGLQALYLMLLEHTGKSRITEQDLQNPKNLDFVRGIENGVTKFEASTGIFATDMLRFGPSKYDIAVVYESSAIAELDEAEGRWGKLRVSYPATTLWSDHPAVVLSAPWVTEEQGRAARQYIAFLRAKPSQERALAYGFRPADTSVKIITADAQNPFARFAGNGLTVDVPPATEMPDGPVVRNLMTMWTRMMRPRAAAYSGRRTGEESNTSSP
ncbi:MAG: substrate-binding domain-containing protein [Deltaproteobacteria bacterium]|nr:substrate-binding domain-containing protein [Deltaproteobacteria bacterium]